MNGTCSSLGTLYKFLGKGWCVAGNRKDLPVMYKEGAGKAELIELSCVLGGREHVEMGPIPLQAVGRMASGVMRIFHNQHDIP